KDDPQLHQEGARVYAKPRRSLPSAQDLADLALPSLGIVVVIAEVRESNHALIVYDVIRRIRLEPLPVGDRVALVPYDRKCRPIRARKLEHMVDLVVDADIDDDEPAIAILLVERLELRDRLLVRRAPCREERHDRELRARHDDDLARRIEPLD